MFNSIRSLFRSFTQTPPEAQESNKPPSSPDLKNVSMDRLRNLGLEQQRSIEGGELKSKSIAPIQKKSRQGLFSRTRSVKQVVSLARQRLGFRSKKHPSAPPMLFRDAGVQQSERERGRALDTWPVTSVVSEKPDAVNEKNLPIPATIFGAFRVQVTDEAESHADALPVYVQRRDPSSSEPETVLQFVSKKEISTQLGVSEGVVQRAANNGALERLVIQAALVPRDEVEAFRSGTGMTCIEAKEVAIAVDSLRDHSTVFGEKVSETAGEAQGVPREIEMGTDEDIFVHLGEKGIEKLGEGGLGKVTKSVRETLGNQDRKGRIRQFAAQKVPRADQPSVALETQLAEAKIGMQLRDVPYVMSTYTFRELQGDSVSIVSELCDGGEFLELVAGVDQGSSKFCDAMSVSDQCRFFAQALEGVKGIHDKGLLHRDLKLENIFVKNVDGKPEPRIGDFGFVCDAKQKSMNFCGTPNYVAPELIAEDLNGDVTNGFGKGSDAWAMGITGLLAFSGGNIGPTWWGMSLNDLFTDISNTGPKLTSQLENDPDFSQLPEGVRNGLLTLLDPDPQKRDLSKAIQFFNSEVQ